MTILDPHPLVADITGQPPFRHPDAACRGTTPELFFFTERRTIAHVRAVCNRCPAQTACLEYAIVHNEQFGVWGGKSVRERRILRREWLAEQRVELRAVEG